MADSTFIRVKDSTRKIINEIIARYRLATGKKMTTDEVIDRLINNDPIIKKYL